MFTINFVIQLNVRFLARGQFHFPRLVKIQVLGWMKIRWGVGGESSWDPKPVSRQGKENQTVLVRKNASLIWSWIVLVKFFSSPYNSVHDGIQSILDLLTKWLMLKIKWLIIRMYCNLSFKEIIKFLYKYVLIAPFHNIMNSTVGIFKFHYFILEIFHFCCYQSCCHVRSILFILHIL